MNIKLNWQQSVVIGCMVFVGIFVSVVIQIDEPFPSTSHYILGSLIAFFALVTGLAIWSRIRYIPRSFRPTERIEEQRRILGDIGWGYLQVLFVTVVFVALAKYFWFQVEDTKYILIPGYGAIAFALTPIIKALETDDAS